MTPSLPSFRMVVSLFLIIGWLGLAQRGSCQSPRPTAPPFNASQLEMEPAPAGGIAIRAGRMFDPQTGTNLANQVILIQGDRITDVGPADRVQIPQGAKVIDLSKATV